MCNNSLLGRRVPVTKDKPKKCWLLLDLRLLLHGAKVFFSLEKCK